MLRPQLGKAEVKRHPAGYSKRKPARGGLGFILLFQGLTRSIPVRPGQGHFTVFNGTFPGLASLLRAASPVLHSLVYVSTTVDAMSHKSLSSLTEQASARNESLGVTGMLLHSDGNLMQCLEGSKESIDVLMKSITSDRRHSGHIVLF